MEKTQPLEQTPEDFWHLVLDDLKLQMTRVTFTTWLQSTRAVGLANGTLSVQVRSQAAQEWLENRLHRKIQDTVDYFSAAPLEIRFVTDPAAQQRSPPNQRSAP